VSAIELEPQQSPDPSMFGVAARSRGMTKFGRPVNAQIMFYGDFFDYRITGLKPGRWYVGVTRYELPAALATAVVEVSTGCVVQDFVLPEPTTPTLSVRVLAPDGAPLHDCEFRVHSQFRGPDGRFSGGIAGAIASQADVGPVFRISTERFADRTTLFAVHPRFGSVPIEVTPDRREYEARFADPAIVTLRLEDFAEHARGRVVTLERRRTGVDEPFPPLPAIPSTGIVELGATQPGTWRFEFVADSDVTDSVSGRPVFAATVELAAGEREITLPFPRLEDVRVSVPNDDRGRITFEPDDGTPDERSRWGLQGETDADLVATIRGVPPGSWIVSTRRGRKMRLQTPVSGVVRFVPTAVRAMRVSITDPSGPIAKAGLATGDLVVAFSGFEFDGQEELYRVLQRLSGEQLTLTVERAGERFEVVIPRKLWSDSSSGARFKEHVR
jgi:hypothetical protein